MTAPDDMARDQSPLEQAVAWFVRQDASPLSPAEQAEFVRWRADPAHDRAWHQVAGMWDDFGAAAASAATKREPVPMRRQTLPRAAVWALAASVVLGLAMMLGGPAWWQADLRTATGEVVEQVLADGSIMVLGSDSAVEIAFSESRRTIRLISGEALFSVAPDRDRPFVVEAGEGSATALGTRFAVRRDGGHVAVTVQESHVQVRCCGADPAAITVAPGQQADFDPGTPGLSVHPVDAEAETAWIRGKLIFSERPLEQVVAALNRYSHGHIVIAGDALRHRLVNGVFKTSDPQAAVDALQQSLALRRIDLGPWLTILRD